MNHMKFEPTFNHVLLRPIKIPQEGRIWTPDQSPQATHYSNYAEVVATGPGEWTHGTFVPTQVKVGDKVLWAAPNYREITLNGENHFIVIDEHILGVLS